MPYEKPLLSIIVPVYKVENYLQKCIDSILAQTFTDFELILVDDGSPDRCWEILQRYAAQDARVRIFRKENGGVSSARNFGLRQATGRPGAGQNSCVQNTDIERVLCKKLIDKSHKKRYILFINALKKSVHRLEPHREPGAAENPAGYRRGTVTLEQKR